MYFFNVYIWDLKLIIDIAVIHWNRSMRREFSFTALLLWGFVPVLESGVWMEREVLFSALFWPEYYLVLGFFSSFRHALCVFCKVTVSEVEKVAYISHKRLFRWLRKWRKIKHNLDCIAHHFIFMLNITQTE